MLTLNSNFTDEFSKAEVEAVLVVQIYTAIGANHAFCTGNEGFTFATIQDAFASASSLAPVDVFPLVVACTPISHAMDPYERTIVKNSVTVTLANHPTVRKFVEDNRLLARAISIKIGTRGLSNEAQWADVFYGVIESVQAREDGIDIECKDFYRWRGAALTHTWCNKHPLEVLKLLLIAQGVPASYIDDDMFDPSHADYADTIGHYCMTHPGVVIRVVPHRSDRVHPLYHLMPELVAMEITEEFEPLIQNLVKLLVGALYFQEDGQIRFVLFNTSTAASANWTEDDIQDVKQLETIIVNQIEMDVEGERVNYGEAYKGNVTIKDGNSQTNHAYPGQSVGIFRRADSFPSVSFHGELGTDISTTGAEVLKVAYPYGLAGTRVPESTYSNPWEGMQSAEAPISVSKPLYVLVHDEVMKCFSLDLLEDTIIKVMTVSTESGNFVALDKPKYANLTILSASRGQLDTTAVVHRDSWLEHENPREPIAKIFDVTMHRGYAATQLQRFANGCEVIELTTSLSQWAIQVGDFVTLTYSNFLSYGFDGIDTGHKWEIIEKELALDDGNARVKFKLAYATKTSPHVIDATYYWPKQGVRGLIDTIPSIRYAHESEVGVSRHTVAGLDTTSSGLVVTIGTGLVGSAGSVTPVKAAQAFTVAANRDHYFSVDTRTASIVVQSVATDAAEPDLGRGLVAMSKVVAGGSTCTLTDQREFGAVRPRNMSTIDFEQGGNLVPNPDFETWSRGPGYPPDHWEVRDTSVVTWGTNATREEATTYSGRYALNINLSTLAGSYIQSHLFRVERDRVYQFGISVKGSTTTAQEMVQIEWMTAAKVSISVPLLVNHNASADTTDMTRYDVFTTAPATAVYARVLLSKWSDASPANGIFDSIRMVRSMPSFFVTNTTQTLIKGSPTVVDFDIEAHDNGGNYDVTLGQNKFTAPFAGLYSFSVQMVGGNLTNGHADSYIFLRKNGSEFLRGRKGYTGTAGIFDFMIETGPVKLAAGDYMQVVYQSAHASDSVFTGATTQNYFSGAQIA